MAKIIRIPSVLVYDTKVVGVSMTNNDGTSRQEIIASEVAEDDPILLQAEPDNVHDPDAIKVLTQNQNQIGYVSKEMAQTLLPAIENGADISVKASWVSGKEILGVGLRIEVVS